MLREDLNELKAILRKNKPNREYEKKFTSILNFTYDD